jgi:hypothetical protein
LVVLQIGNRKSQRLISTPTYSYATSVDFQRTTECYVTEDTKGRTLYFESLQTDTENPVSRKQVVSTTANLPDAVASIKILAPPGNRPHIHHFIVCLLPLLPVALPLNKFTELCPSCEASSHSRNSQRFLDVHYRVHMSPPLIPVLNLIHTTSHFSETHFNIILPSTSKPS